MVSTVGISRTCLAGLWWTILSSVAVAAAPTSVTVSLDGGVQLDAGSALTPPRVFVPWRDDSGLAVTVDLTALKLEPVRTDAGEFVELTCPDGSLAGEKGAPALPVVRRMFATALGAYVDYSVREAPPVDLDLKEAGYSGPIIPVQGPAGVERNRQTITEFNPAAYSTDAWTPSQRVSITPAGIARGQQLYLLEVRPVAYSPAQNLLRLWPRIEVELYFDGGVIFPNLRPTAGFNRAVLNPPRLTDTRGGTLLIIAAPDFSGSAPLNQFIDFKTSQGFTVSTYTPTVGSTLPTIKAYLQSLWSSHSAPEYVLIVGDANDTTWVTGPWSIGTYAGVAPRVCRTDVPLVCMDGGEDWFPDIPIGRIPVRTTSDLQNVINKIIYVESGNYADPGYTARAVFIAGTDTYSGSEAMHNYMIDTYMTPNRISSNRVYATQGGTTQDVINAINAGCFLASYFGHAAGFQAWGSPPFTFADIEALTNVNLYPVVLSYTCSPAAFHYTTPTASPGFLEKWLLEPNKGAAAGYGELWSQEPYTWESWQDMYRFLFRALYDNQIRELGPAYQAAAAYFVTQYGLNEPISRDYTNEWYLLGDPSMRLPDPPAENYLIVAASSYVGSTALNQFIAHKQSQGMNVIVYNVAPGTSRTAIREYIRSLWNTAESPNYILIVGDTSGTGSATATTIPHFVGGGSKQAATDWPYGCMDDPNTDWYPEVPVGRFPVINTTQLQAMVDKTIHVESGAFSDPNCITRAGFAVNPDTYNTGEPTAEYIISTWLQPNGYTPVRLYAAQGANTQSVTNAVNNGLMWLTYMGHSGSSGWWDPAFNQSNVQALSNTGKYPVVAGWSCNTAHFDYDECFGETWVRVANKGASVYISASNYIYWGSVEAWRPSGILEKAMFAAYFEDDIWRVGPAWLAALYRFLNEYGQPAYPGGPPTQNADIVRNFFEEFVILGDPSLRLPRPDGFRVSASPSTQSVCAPPGQGVTYSITVDRLGNFAQPVTLTAEGVPAGATVSFSSNNQIPPYSSVLSLGNLGSVTPDNYTITIRGTAGPDEQVATVGLTVANSAPSTPTLISPPNGALNVSRTPTLQWSAVAQTAQYEVQVSRYTTFTPLVFGAFTTNPSVTVSTNLDAGQTYYWRVRAQNDCGESTWSTPFQFTTIVQGDYFTEQFTGSGDAFDLTYRTLFWIPNGSGNYYLLCSAPASSLPTDPAGSTPITGLGDDGSAAISFATPISLYGTSYTSLYVNANGNLTFGSGDSTYNETLSAHFSRARIAALFDDLNPGAGGTVSWKTTADRVVITFQNVPEYSVGGANTFQFELFYNGEIHITYLAVSCSDAIVGLSRGTGQPSDFVESDLSSYGPCEQPGACCLGETCSVALPSQCAASGGTFQGEGIGCTPNPCLENEPGCIIISEVVQGTESGDCPRFVELTNTSDRPFTFLEGGLIVQTGSSNDLTVDVDLTGVTIPPGASFVIASNASGSCTGAFQGIYGFPADRYTNFTFGYGNERFILTDKADGSHILDIYGQFGVDGTGTVWEFTDGYAYRLPGFIAGYGLNSDPTEWFFGGVGSLSGYDPTQLLLTLTTPGTHTFSGTCQGLRGDLDLDGDVDATDLNGMLNCLHGPNNTPPQNCGLADLDHDGDVDLRDVAIFQRVFTGAGN